MAMFEYRGTYNRFSDDKKIVLYKDNDVCSETFESLRFEVYQKFGEFYHIVNWGKTYGKYKTIVKEDLYDRLDKEEFKYDVFCHKPYKIEYDQDDLYVFI